MDTPASIARRDAEAVLARNCGGCHGSALALDTARGGINYIDDLQKLANNQRLIPLDSEASPIIIRMRNGSMPPPGDGFQRVAQADIDIVADYIDNAEYWPGAPRISCSTNPAMDFDVLYGDVAADLRRQDAEDRPFIRYISLGNRVGAGVCVDTALDLERQALVKMLNSLSIDPVVRTPDIVNEQQTLFSIDIRDIQWDRAITVDGAVFDDVWEAIIAFNQYAVPFEGDEAEDARAVAETEVPVMFLDSMLDQATIGNLYYAIIDVDVAQSLDEFIINQLNIDVADNLENEDLVRAGTTQSEISRQDRLIEGHDIKIRPGFYYQSFDFADVQNESIFQNPFGFNEGGREAIFTLPNGMMAYLIADADGNLVQDSDILSDPTQGNNRAITSVSCAYCHADGLIPAIDEVRPVVRRTALSLIADGTLSQDQLDQLENVYLPPESFKARLEEQSEAFYLNALRQADLPLQGIEPVSSVFLRFDGDMKLGDAAGDLGIGRAELEDVIQLLDPALNVLVGGTLDRDDFTAQYLESLCIVSASNRNRPQQAICDTVLGN